LGTVTAADTTTNIHRLMVDILSVVTTFQWACPMFHYGRISLVLYFKTGAVHSRVDHWATRNGFPPSPPQATGSLSTTYLCYCSFQSVSHFIQNMDHVYIEAKHL